MRSTLVIIVTGVLALILSGCNPETSNSNANTNTMANANANMAARNANANATANANTNRAPTREEYEKDKDRYAREAKQAGRTIGTGLNDGWLWTKARFELATANDLRDSTINVDVDNAVVTLTGTVANAPQKAKAEQVVKGLDGVKSVKNMLKISATGNTNTNTNANTNAKKTK